MHDKQHLFLVDNHPVGLLKDTGQGRIRVTDRLKAMFGLDKGRDVLHRPRAVEGYHGSNITEGGWLKLFDVAAHTRPLQLEDAGSFAIGEQLKGLGIVHREMVEVNLDTPVLIDNLFCLTQDSEVSQTEEVHLQKADAGNVFHGELGHHGAFTSSLAGSLQRHMSGEGFFGDNNTGGMSAGMTSNTLYPPG